MMSIVLPRLFLLLVTQQAFAGPADSEDNQTLDQLDNIILAVHTNDASEDLVTSGSGQTRAKVTSIITNAETEESKSVSQSNHAMSQGSPILMITSQNNPTETFITSSLGSSQTRGFLSNLDGSYGTAGSQTSNKPEERSVEPRAGQQSATNIVVTTYPEGSKPATSSKPSAGQQKPISSKPGQNNPSTGTLTPSVTSPQSQSKPPYSSLNEEFLTSLFGLYAAGGKKKPNRPPSPPGPGASQFGLPYYGSSFLGSHSDDAATLPNHITGFKRPPSAGYLPYPPLPPKMFGAPFGGFVSLFRRMGNSFESDESPIPATFLHDIENESGFAVHPSVISLVKSFNTSPTEISDIEN